MGALLGLLVGVSTVGTGGLGPTLFWRRPSVASLGCCGMCGVWCTILVGWCATLQFGGRLLIYMKNYISEFKSAACPVVHSARWPDANGEDNIFTLFSFMRVNEVGGLIMGIEENRILKHILLIV